MERPNSYRVERWCDKTMSVLKEQQLEACQERLALCPGQGIFTSELCEDELRDLWSRSFYCPENPAGSLSQSELQALVLSRVAQEACFLSPKEDDLVLRMLSGGGQAQLMDWDEISAAEALVARLWCQITVQEDESVLLQLPQPLVEPVIAALDTERYTKTRARLYTFDAMLHSLLYLSGFLHASVPVEHLLGEISADRDEVTRRLIVRYLQAAFDYTKDGQGEMLLVHPGLAEPGRLIDSLGGVKVPEMHLTEEMMRGGMNGILPEEIAASESMRGALIGAVRPEYDIDEALEDLRMMAKQGARLPEMREVLESVLCVLPTPRMLQALTQLHLQTVRWMGMPSAVLN